MLGLTLFSIDISEIFQIFVIVISKYQFSALPGLLSVYQYMIYYNLYVDMSFKLYTNCLAF